MGDAIVEDVVGALDWEYGVCPTCKGHLFDVKYSRKYTADTEQDTSAEVDGPELMSVICAGCQRVIYEE